MVEYDNASHPTKVYFQYIIKKKLNLAAYQYMTVYNAFTRSGCVTIETNKTEPLKRPTQCPLPLHPPHMH